MGRTLPACGTNPLRLPMLIGMILRVTTLAACAVASAAACSVATAATTSARVGTILTVRAHDLEPGRYALTLVSDDRPTRQGSCLARMADPTRTHGGKVTLSGKVPRRLTCYEGNGTKLGRVKVTPGAYHLVVAVPDGPAGFDADHSFVRRALRIKR